MEEATTIPLYLNWSFWAVVVAAIAVLLSQIPPIHLLLKRAKLDIELFSRIHITHKVGNPNLQLHVIVNNIGGRAVKIKGITTEIKRDGQTVSTLESQNYLLSPNDVNSILFTSFTLKPNEEWAHIVNFLNYFPREIEKKYRAAELQLKNDIYSKKEKQLNKEEIVEAEQNNIKPFTELFNELFIWKPGEYELIVKVKTKPHKASISKKYRYTLFESDSEELIRYTEYYKYGAGIYFDSTEHTGVIVQIAEL